MGLVELIYSFILSLAVGFFDLPFFHSVDPEMPELEDDVEMMEEANMFFTPPETPASEEDVFFTPQESPSISTHIVRPPLVTHLPPEQSLPQQQKNHRPLLIASFIVIRIVMFLVTMAVNNCREHTLPPNTCSPTFLGRLSFQPTSENPLYGPSDETLIHMGGLYLSNGLHMHQAWRLLTNIWLNEGFAQLVTDVIALLGAGIQLERKFGSVRVGLLYFLSGFGGSLFSALFFRTVVIVGANGALAGLSAASLSDILIEYFILHLKKGFDSFITMVVMLFTIGATIFQHGDNFTTIGGLLVGFAFGFVIFSRPPMKKLHCTIILLVIIIGLLTGTVMVLKGVNMNEHCPWCHYLDCVPFSGWSCKYRTNNCEKEENSMGDLLTMTCKRNGRTAEYHLKDYKPPESTEELCYRLCIGHS